MDQAIARDLPHLFDQTAEEKQALEAVLPDLFRGCGRAENASHAFAENPMVLASSEEFQRAASDMIAALKVTFDAEAEALKAGFAAYSK